MDNQMHPYGQDVAALARWIHEHRTLGLYVAGRILKKDAVKYIHRHVKPDKAKVKAVRWLATHHYISAVIAPVEQKTLTELFAMGILIHVARKYMPEAIAALHTPDQMVYTLSGGGAVMCQIARDVFGVGFEPHIRAGKTRGEGIEWTNRPADSGNWCLFLFNTPEAGDFFMHDVFNEARKHMALHVYAQDWFYETLETAEGVKQEGFAVRVWQRNGNDLTHAYSTVEKLWKRVQREKPDETRLQKPE